MPTHTRPVVLMLVLWCMGPPLASQSGGESVAQDSTAAPVPTAPALGKERPSTFRYKINGTVGATFQDISRSNQESTSFQWLANLRARAQLESSSSSITSVLNMQYGQLHRPRLYPEKTQDNLMLSITPSVVILPASEIRLFVEATGETTMKEGFIDTARTSFLDPLFVYLSVFVGQKIESTTEDGNAELNLTYGVGYAAQATVTKNFILEPEREFKTSTDNPLSTVEVESGVTAVVDLGFRQQISEESQFNVNLKTVYLGKERTWQDYTKSRVSSLATMSLSYSVFTIDYTMRLIYDSNYSLRRQLDQSLVYGVRISL